MNKVYFTDVNNLKKSFSYEEIYSKVSSYRKNKVNKLLSEKDKWLSLSAEYLLMQGLNELDIDYSKIEIGFTENNKPVLKNCPEKLFFNVSHSENMAMCIISNYEVGCDIQKISEKRNYLKIAKKFFHQKEFQMLKNANKKNAIELFYKLWVLKESYIKATGKGFRTPLESFRISFDYTNPKVFLNDKLEDGFYLEEINVEDTNYKSAICIKKDDKD